MDILYSIEPDLSVTEFVAVLKNSGLAERRPVENLECIAGMLKGSDLTVCARVNGKLIGIARCVTDFSYACYLSDLAVDKEFQGLGIGIELQRKTQEELGSCCTLILIAAPNEDEYYNKIGYERHSLCWVLKREDTLK